MNERIPSTNSPATTQPPARGRRRFLGAGVSATPALLTLASQPALGVTCFTPSRSLSRNTSVSQQGKNGECNGQSPGNYGAQTDPGIPAYTWPAKPQPNDPFYPLFSNVLKKNRFLITIYTNKQKTKTGTRSLTLLEVLNLNPNSSFADMVPNTRLPVDPANLAKHLIAAYLNCVNGFIPTKVLPKEQVLLIWR